MQKAVFFPQILAITKFTLQVPLISWNPCLRKSYSCVKINAPNKSINKTRL
jgi:hypothetical protein